MATQNAVQQVRIYKSTHKRLKIKAAKKGKSLAEYIDLLEKNKLSALLAPYHD